MTRDQHAQDDFSMKNAEHALEQFSVDRRAGLSLREVEKRRQQYGSNVIEGKRPLTLFMIIIAQVRNVLFILLAIAALASIVVGETLDAVIILAVALLHVVIGTVEEYKAEKEFQSLKRAVESFAIVVRQGMQKKIPTTEIVPGDILFLSEGMLIPADSRILDAHHLQVNEAMLTGEQTARTKNAETLKKAMPLGDRTNMLFMGTSIMTGSGTAVVVRTGSSTEIGEIVNTVRSQKETKTPLQKRIERFVLFIGIVAAGIIILVVGIGWALHEPFIEMFTLAISLAVSAVPEGLAAGFFIVLALGMRRMFKKKAITQKLVAAETLGSVNVLCVDKTGTLTEGKMQVTEVLTASGVKQQLENHWKRKKEEKIGKEVNDLLLWAVLASDAFCEGNTNDPRTWKCVGDETEQAILRGAGVYGVTTKSAQSDWAREDVIPFNATVKYMATLMRRASTKEKIVAVKGAPEVIIERSSTLRSHDGVIHMNSTIMKRWHENIETLSSRGLRVLAIATRSVHDSTNELKEDLLENLEFLGLIAIRDPIREGAKTTIMQAAKAGVRTVIVTGDHKVIAQRIASELGLKTTPQSMIDGKEMESLSAGELRSRIDDIAVFSRITPKDKMRIVKALKEKGNVVAMTGDGVNDAPALQAADIGIAVASGTDVAKETADMVLLDDNIRTIIDAIKEGRRIYDNMKKIALYLVSDSFSEVFLILTAIVLRLPAPLIAVQILWINIASDGLLDLALAVEPPQDDVMKIPPRKKEASIMTREGTLIVGIVTIISVAASFLAYRWAYTTTGNLDYARTLAFTVLAVDSIFYVLSIRVARHALWSSNPLKNRWLIAAMATTLLLQIIAVYIPALNRLLHTTPLHWRDWGIVAGIALTTTLAIEALKFGVRIVHRNDRMESVKMNA